MVKCASARSRHCSCDLSRTNGALMPSLVAQFSSKSAPVRADVITGNRGRAGDTLHEAWRTPHTSADLLTEAVHPPHGGIQG